MKKVFKKYKRNKRGGQHYYVKRGAFINLDDEKIIRGKNKSIYESKLKTYKNIPKDVDESVISFKQEEGSGGVKLVPLTKKDSKKVSKVDIFSRNVIDKEGNVIDSDLYLLGRGNAKFERDEEGRPIYVDVDAKPKTLPLNLKVLGKSATKEKSVEEETGFKTYDAYIKDKEEREKQRWLEKDRIKEQSLRIKEEKLLKKQEEKRKINEWIKKKEAELE